jgi:hypothetical protein
MDYVVIPQEARDGSMDEFLPIGAHVRVKPGFASEGQEGVITAWGRGVQADETFRASGDFEILIDNEGPVVTWDEGTVGATDADDSGTHWFPGQSMVVLETV